MEKKSFYIVSAKRMCNYCGHCEGCPLKEVGCALDPIGSDDDFERVITTVEQWSKEHPLKTRQSVFLRVIPNLRLDKAGSIQLCPATITGERCEVYGAAYENCYDCRKNFWGQEVE